MDGVFNLLLGSGTVLEGTFDSDLFAAENRYLEVIVDTEVLDPRQPFSSVAYALQSGESDAATYADTAGDADTVDGSHAASLDQSAHVSDTGNPHGVTAGQVGAATSSQLASHAGDASAHHTKTTSFAELSGTATDGQIPNNITVNHAANADTVDGLHASAFSMAGHNHDDRYYTKAQVDALETRIAQLEALLLNVTRSGNGIYIDGANLHVRDGSGGTDGAVNGLGNLIVGYNELRPLGSNDRTGSHNIVVGEMQNFSSYGGLVAGRHNSIGGRYASVSGGQGNLASGDNSSVRGGRLNTASGTESSISGGEDNTASGQASSISGATATV